MTRSAALLVLALLLLPAAAAGNGPADATSFADSTGFNTQRKMVRDADGGLFLAFVVPAKSGNATEVVVAREKDGARVELGRPSAGRGDASRPSLALDGQGRLWVAWTERAEEDREVFAARWDGSRFVDAQQLSGGQGYAGFPSLATDAQGRLHVAWYGFDGIFYQTFYRRLDASGWSPAEQLSSGNLDANNPSVVVDAQGGVHVAWYKSDGHRYRAWYAERASGEGAWSLPRAISQGDGEAFNVALAVDAKGVVHATWDELHEAGYEVLHATRQADGSFSTPRVLASGGDAGEYPALAPWDGGVLVAWERKSDGLLVGTNLSAPPAPLLGGVRGRDPSLRGPGGFPASERADVLDVLWTEPANGTYLVKHAALASGCSPFEPRCAAPREPARVPGAAWAPFAALALVAIRRGFKPRA